MKNGLYIAIAMMMGMIVTFPTIGTAGLNFMWAQSYHQTSTNKDDYAFSITVDQNDNILFVGTTVDDTDNVDVLSVKYDPDGQFLWDYVYDGPDGNADRGYQLLISNSGSVFIAGSQENDASRDGLLIKLNSSGSYQWAATYDGNDNLDDAYYLIRQDSSGNIVCGGYHERLLYGTNALFSVYDSSGTNLSSYAANGTGNTDDFASDIAIDSNGNTYMAGTFINNGTFIDVGLVKILPDGTMDWTDSFNGTANLYDYGGSIALDSSDNIFLSGTFNDATGGYDAGLSLVDPQSTIQWTNTFDGTYHFDERLPNVNPITPYIYYGNSNLEMGSSGNLFLIANDSGSKSSYNIVLYKISDTGNLIWRQDFDGPAMASDYCWDVVVDSQENVYIAGQVKTSSSLRESAVIQYDTDGNLLDAQYFSGTDGLEGQAYTIVLDSNENPIIAGTIEDSSTGKDAFVAKYCAGCFIDDACYPDGAVNPSNQDEICDVSLSQTAWSENSGDDDDDDDDTSDDDDDDDDDTSDDDDDDDTASDDDDDDSSNETSSKSDDDDGCCG